MVEVVPGAEPPVVRSVLRSLRYPECPLWVALAACGVRARVASPRVRPVRSTLTDCKGVRTSASLVSYVYPGTIESAIREAVRMAAAAEATMGPTSATVTTTPSVASVLTPVLSPPTTPTLLPVTAAAAPATAVPVMGTIVPLPNLAALPGTGAVPAVQSVINANVAQAQLMAQHQLELEVLQRQQQQQWQQLQLMQQQKLQSTLPLRGTPGARTTSTCIPRETYAPATGLFTPMLDDV